MKQYHFPGPGRRDAPDSYRGAMRLYSDDNYDTCAVILVPLQPGFQKSGQL
ncbi:MAG: hypothetical protein AAFP77_07090 [Bacteroidota bacterium]